MQFAFAGTVGFDYGFNDLLKVTMTDGTTRGIAANEGLFLSLGALASYLDGRQETQATLGIKGWSINASNGNASIVVFPLELLEAVNVAPLRLAAGVIYLHKPSTSGDGLLKAFDGAKFDSSVGLVFQGEWIVATPHHLRMSMGPRYVWQKLRVQGGGAVVDGSALGFVISASLR